MVGSWRSILALVVFFLTNIVGVFPFKISIPVSTPVLDAFVTKAAVFLRVCLPTESCCKDHPRILTNGCREGERRPVVIWRRITIGFQTAPLVAVLLLLATGVLHGKEIREGITGTSGIEPLDIMALFISLAYLAISLDTTGLFRFLAFWVVRKGGSSGRRLYLYLYTFFFVAGILVGNDPVVLFGTPFLAYFARASGIIPPTAWVFAQFMVANTAAAVLPSANLTNLVLTGAFSLSYITYAAHAILPTLATGVALYPLLAFVLFRSTKYVPRRIDVVQLQHPHVDATGTHAPDALTDKSGAIFGSVLLGVTLVVLVGTSPLKIPVWMVTVPPALIMLGRDIWHDRHLWKKTQHANEPLPSDMNDSIPMQVMPTSKSNKTDAAVDTQPVQEQIEETRSQHTLDSLYQKITKDTFPTLFTIAPRLPASLVLFAFCMFILVQALTTQGWVEVFAGWWAWWIRVCSNVGTGFATVGAIYGMLVISTFLCNICGTNIGTTILLARVLQSWLSSSNTTVDNKVRLGAIYALALGSNFGAYTFSFSASLAGLLWRDILRQKGIAVSQRQFAWFNLPAIALAVVVSGAVLVAEVYVVAH
ncbi:arsenical pump membrane protein-domain-containing protein [Irpex lacteus]|nr:arsenical pump membrane protein-domain-containing protein [Irpex lacteus]